MIINTLPADLDDVDDTPYWRALETLEKVLTAAPAYTMRTSSSVDAELDERLTNMLDDVAGCRTRTWSRVYEHSGSPGSYTARICTALCRRRGCPTCGRDHVERETEKHRDRIEETFGSGVVQLRLSAGLSAGPADVFADFARWRNRRTVTLPPGLAIAHPDGDGRYGLSLLVSADTDGLEQLGESWSSATNGTWTFEAVDAAVDPFDHVVDTRTAAQAAIFALVDEGVVEPETARRWLIEEHKKKRFRLIGGFLGADSTDEKIVVGVAKPRPTPPKSPDELLADVATLAATSIESHLERFYEDRLRTIEEQAAELDDPAPVLEAVAAALDRLPDSYFTCTAHPRCRVIPTDLRIRTRHLDDQVAARRVEYHGELGEYRGATSRGPGGGSSLARLRRG